MFVIMYIIGTGLLLNNNEYTNRTPAKKITVIQSNY